MRIRTFFFFVNKGNHEIKIVHNGSDNAVNHIAWVPLFLPTTLTLVTKLETNTFQLNVDIGDMFLNFSLQPSAWKRCGFNLSRVKGLLLKE